MALFVIFLNFLRLNFLKFLRYIEYGGIRILNTKKVGFVLAVFQISENVFNRWRKTGQINFAEKRAPTKVKYLLPVCPILRNFTVGNARKFTISFAFCAHVDVIKSRKTLTFSCERAQITWAFVNRAIILFTQHPHYLCFFSL